MYHTNFAGAAPANAAAHTSTTMTPKSFFISSPPSGNLEIPKAGHNGPAGTQSFFAWLDMPSLKYSTITASRMMTPRKVASK